MSAVWSCPGIMGKLFFYSFFILFFERLLCSVCCMCKCLTRLDCNFFLLPLLHTAEASVKGGQGGQLPPHFKKLLTPLNTWYYGSYIYTWLKRWLCIIFMLFSIRRRGNLIYLLWRKRNVKFLHISNKQHFYLIVIVTLFH